MFLLLIIGRLDIWQDPRTKPFSLAALHAMWETEQVAAPYLPGKTGQIPTVKLTPNFEVEKNRERKKLNHNFGGL